MSKFKKILFATDGEILEVSIKGEFHQATCKHEFKKGKLIRGTSAQNLLAAKRSKDITMCIKCGKGKAKENGRKKVSKKTL
ncbi:hypothetical protein BBG48_008605 [Criibacterium bergeronii]|uniref:Uncharacterized protein n=1 Tax=Criibacterium bergeronii TaxID=1871336 RepID=A0A371IJU6_9FIRM|nr:hypothetical protein BBG48_008605 [Criibacterium bergeronii]